MKNLLVGVVLLFVFLAGCAGPPPVAHLAPPRTISAYALECNESGNSSVVIVNTSPHDFVIQAGSLEAPRVVWKDDLGQRGDSNGLAKNNSADFDSCPERDLAPGEKTQCVLVDFHMSDFTTAIYGQDVASATVKC